MRDLGTKAFRCVACNGALDGVTQDDAPAPSIDALGIETGGQEFVCDMCSVRIASERNTSAPALRSR